MARRTIDGGFDDEDDRPRGRSRGGDKGNDFDRTGRPARRSGMPGWVWALIVPGGIGLVCVMICGGCLLSGVAMSNSAAPGQKRDEANAVPLTVGQEQRVGDVGITVTGCTEEIIYGASPSGKEYFSETPYTVIGIKLKNHNPTKNAEVYAQTGAAKVTDEFGNALDSLTLRTEAGFPCRLYGQIGEGKYLELRSDTPGEDKLVVVQTVPAARRVKVLLDASKYGGKGYLVADIPIKGKK